MFLLVGLVISAVIAPSATIGSAGTVTPVTAADDAPRPGLLAARQGLRPGHYESVGRGQERDRMDVDASPERAGYDLRRSTCGVSAEDPGRPLPIDKLHWLLRRSVVGYFIGHDTDGLLTGPGSVEGSMASWPGLPHGH